VSIERVSPPLIKYLLVVAAGLLVVAYVPEITLWLPRSFGVIH
jgi:TRAP-type C4-dicarboxylate transport system permease large subunit